MVTAAKTIMETRRITAVWGVIASSDRALGPCHVRAQGARFKEVRPLED
jgi:hypothetical protein